MRAWGWIGGGLVVLVGGVLVISLMGAPRSSTSEMPRLEGAKRGARAVRTILPQRGTSGEIAAPIRMRIEREGNGLASEIDRQRSAMRGAVALLVAGERAGARIR